MSGQVATVGVVGLGSMGAGIVEVLARSGLRVIGVEPTREAVDRGRGLVEASTARAVARGRLPAADREALLARLTLGTEASALAEADLVIEAVPEVAGLKREVFAILDRVCRPGAVLATNTSSLSVTEIAHATARPERVVGMHFFNPAPVLRLVEVVRTVTTDASVVDTVADLARRLGKVPVVVGDRAGFVANALLFGYLNRAVAVVEHGVATAADVDTAMTAGAGMPMGPLALLDLVGLDTSVQILDTMWAQSRDPRHAPVPLLRRLVAAGRLGRKSGRGFYGYGAQETAGEGTAVGGDVPADDGPPGGEVRVGVVGEEAVAARVHDLAGAAGLRLVGTAEATVVLAAADDGPVLETAMGTARPERVVGVVLAGPRGEPAVAQLLPTVVTAAPALAAARAVIPRLGLPTVVCRDGAGAIVDALLYPYLNDAVRMVESGYADVEDVDTAMTLGCGFPEGPFATLDRLGPARALAVQQRLYDESREPGLASAALLRQLVAAGRGFRV